MKRNTVGSESKSPEEAREGGDGRRHQDGETRDKMSERKDGESEEERDEMRAMFLLAAHFCWIRKWINTWNLICMCHYF